ncbi:MAG: TolC family protein [Cyanobacteria bacterium P01_H01_bin.74]
MNVPPGLKTVKTARPYYFNALFCSGLFFFLLLLHCLLVFPVKVYAQSDTEPGVNSIDLEQDMTGYGQLWPQALLELQPSSKSRKALLLTDIMASTVFYHPELEAAIAKLQQAEGKLLSTKGAFDVQLKTYGFWNRYQTSSGEGKAKQTFDGVNKLAWLSRSGIQLSAGNKLIYGDVSSKFSPVGDGGEHFFELRVPLLKGLINNKANAKQQQADIQLSQADVAILNKRLSLLQKAAKQYWNWFTSGKKLMVTEDLVRLADIRYGAVKRQAELGDKADIQVTEAEQALVKRKALLAKERAAFLKAAQVLRLYLWNGNTQQFSDTPPSQTQLPAQLPTIPLFSDDLVDNGKILAYASNPELKRLSLGKKFAQVDWRLARNNLLPQLDAYARPGYQPGNNGIDGTIRTGIVLSVPLQRRDAKGRLRTAQFRMDEIDANERLLLAAIQVNVTSAVISIEQAMNQVEQTRQQTVLALKLAAAERRRFQLGDSSLFLVNTRERQAAEAQKDNLAAYKTLMMAWLSYWIVTVQL